MILREAKTRVIDEFEYEVTPLGAIKGSQVFVKLLKILGPAFSSSDASKMFEGLGEDDVTYLVKAFGPMTMVHDLGSLEHHFDNHFAGKYMAMLKWLGFCLEVNFSDFFGEKGAGLSNAVSAMKTRLSVESPKDATGSSGVS